MRIKVEWVGLEKAIRDLRRYGERVALAAEHAAYVEAEETIADAKKLTPVDEGPLRASGFVQLPEKDEQGTYVDMGFGGPAGTGNQGSETNGPTEKNPTGNVGYAVYVHENLTAHHTVGQAKFLEAPLNARKAGFSRRMAARMRAFLK